MPVAFHILPERGLVVVRYSGVALIRDTVEASKAYVAHPDFAHGQKQLVDLSAVTEYERDYVAFMLMQAAKAGRFANAGVQSLVVYIAPTPIAQELSALFIRSWDDVDAVVPMVQQSESEALTLLGQPENTIAALLSTADRSALQ